MRVPAVLPIVSLSLASLAIAQSVAGASSGGSRLYYYATPRSTLETEVHNIPADDGARFNHLKSLFADQGCSGDQLKIQPAGEKREPGAANLICTWGGSSGSAIVVLAEYQHEGKGQSAVENWSGAVMLPWLYRAMQARPRENDWIFVESAGKAGEASYVRSLSGEQKKHIRAMVALTSLGVSPVLRFYSTDPEEIYVSPPVGHLQMTLGLATLSDPGVPRPEAVNPRRWLTFDGTQPFRESNVPSILLDSIADTDAGIPGSVHDTAAAIDGNAYFMNYRAIAVFLVALDSVASRLQSDDRIWHGEGGQFHLNQNDLPATH